MAASTDRPLSEILTTTDISTIHIPIFQRPYSWGKEQLSQFFNDLKNANSNNNSHFFGLIVYVFQDKGDKVIDVIDGQQRLTTCIISLSVLRDLMEDLDKNAKWSEDDIERNSEAISKVKTALRHKKECRLKTANEKKFENLFLEVIQKAILDFADKNESPRVDYENQKAGSKNRFAVKSDFLQNLGDKRVTKSKNSYKNYISIHNYFKDVLDKANSNEEKFELLISYSDTLLDNFRYIPFEVKSYDQAFEYFEVLNDRGLEISALDLIKNECLKKKLTDAEREDIFDLWTEIFSNVLDHSHNLIQFVRYAYMCERGHITKREIYASYKGILSKMSADDLKGYLSDKLLRRAKVYKNFVSEDSFLKPKIHNAIQLLISTKTVQWYSIAIAVLEPLFAKKKIKINLKIENKIVRLLELLHEIMFSINYVNVVANNIETKFPDIAQSIDSSNEKKFEMSLDNAIKRIINLKLQEKLSFSNVDINLNLTNVFESNNQLGNMLVFLFKYYRKKSSSDKFSCATLEHMFPQNPNINTWPIINKMTKDEKREMTYSVGNFFTTDPSSNSSLGNKSFKDKKHHYKLNNFFDILPPDNALNYLKVKTWDKDIVQKRTQWIINKFDSDFKNGTSV
jgi:uncharacterized protein with ParB-like and HNH nuclease domain